MQLVLRALKLAEPLNKVIIDSGLQFISVLDEFEEPLTVGGQIVARLQLIGGNAIRVG